MAEKKEGHRNAQKVATSDGYSYSVFLRKEKEWRTTPAKKVAEYTPFKGYTPHHQKNLKRACKLFLEAHWPGFAKPEFNASKT